MAICTDSSKIVLSLAGDGLEARLKTNSKKNLFELFLTMFVHDLIPISANIQQLIALEQAPALVISVVHLFVWKKTAKLE